MDTLKTIKAGQILTAVSVCDSNCIFKAEVISRTEKTATVKIYNEVKRCKISVYNGAEQIYAMGKYSMCPIFTAK